MKRLALVVLLALAGCAQLQQKVQLDTSSAIERAKAFGSPAALNRAQCYEKISPLFVPTAGVFDFYEQISEGQELAQGDCASVAVGVAVDIAKLRP